MNSERTKACPVCGSISVHTKRGSMPNNRVNPERHRCKSCQHHFDTPEWTTRSPGNAGGNSILERILKEREDDDA